MAMGKMREPEIVTKLNPGGEVVCAKVEPERKAVSLSPGHELVRLRTESWFKPKRGSVIPAKRKSVKRMFDLIVQSIAHVLCARPLPSSSATPRPSKLDSCFKMGQSIHPQHPS
ncbi:hypothetical protein CJ030_MR8G020193 [Morella rubra]|uniref:Uncharacterized protein n=1 Tax=Morella rubra TaxID=262757 RepID=A0A6A1UQF7_9ROSI|nr:hypothetical protein CJ030_MR8G020193 [Morella rubra]